jgi:broad specificity phosphatase PhoE
MPAVYLVRHGQASFGSSNYDVLSPVGHRQAELVATELRRRGVSPAVLVSGALQRQLDTALASVPLLVAVATDATDTGSAATAGILTDPRWNEYDHMALLHSRRAATLWAMAGGAGRDRSRSVQKVLDGALLDWVSSGAQNAAGQTWPEFADGAMAALTELMEQSGSGGSAVVFTSGGVIAAVCTRILGLPAEGFVALNRVTVNTGITALVGGRSGTSLLSFNEHAHVAGSPDLLTYR